MADYTKNLQNSFGGHTDPDTYLTVKNTRSPLDDMADVRDLLSAIVGVGKGGLKPDDQLAVYSRLGVLLGKPAASKLINHVLVFNQRADTVGKTAEQRITQFYDMGSNDPGINTLIRKTAQMGEGPVSGANQSVTDLTNKISKGISVRDSDNKNDKKISQAKDKLSGL